MELMREAAKAAEAEADAKAALEARREKAAETLSQLYGELNNFWTLAEQRLRSMLPPRECWFEYYQEERSRGCLGMVKYRGDWRICHGYYDILERNPPTSLETGPGLLRF